MRIDSPLMTNTVATGSFSGSFSGDGTGLTGVGGNPGGSNTQVQFNDNGSFGGSSNLTFDGTNLIVGGKLTATEIVTNVVSQSISFATGSNRFGDEISDTHTFTGSLLVTGSTHNIFGNVGIGTTSPAEKLTVEGNISGSACIMVGSGHSILYGSVSSITGGENNTILGGCGFIGGGKNNCIDLLEHASAIVGGCDNYIDGDKIAIVGGNLNSGSSNNVFIGGGTNNSVSGPYSSIVGGRDNCIYLFESYSNIGGGHCNCIDGDCSTIGGGYQNRIFYSAGTIGGGTVNTVCGLYSTIGGGSTNITCAGESYATIGGGYKNAVDGDCSTIAGGSCNLITANVAIIAGGTKNTGSGACSGILGGKNNYVNHANSMIIGSDLTSDKACYTFMNNLDVAGTVSGSVFSGSFVGDGSGLTGISGIDGSGTTDYMPIFTNSTTLGNSPIYKSTALDATNGALAINTTDLSSTYGSVPDLRIAGVSTNDPGVLDLLRKDGTIVADESAGILQFSVDDDNMYTISQIEATSANTAGSGNSGGGNLLFKTTPYGSGTTPTERMRITSAGNVHIGDINYAYGGTNYHIKFGEDSGDTYISNVNGTAFMSAGGYYYGAACRQLTDGNTAYVATRLDPAGDFHIESLTGATANGNNNTATCKFTVKGSGNVGIGTSSPDQALHVSGRGLFDTGASTPDSTTGTYEKGITLTGGNMRLVMDTSNVLNGGSYIQTRHQSTSFPNAYYKLHLNPLGGGVGINAGTLAPTGSLHVEGPAYIKGGTIDVGDSVSTAAIVMDCNTFIYSKHGQYLRNIIGTDNANNIRIGQSGTSLIHEITLQPGTSGGCVRIYNDSTEYARFTNSKFGIGTTDPQATLHADYGSVVAPSLTFGATAGQILQNENSEFAFGLHNASPYPLWIQGRNSSNTARNITLQPLGGNIGIGTYSPSSLLDVDGTTTTVTLVETSTKELKEDIQPLDSQLENLKKLKPIEFAWKKDKKKDFGLLAEDVEKVYPYLVEHDEEDKLIGVKYSKLTSVLVKALQEQQEQIDELKDEIKVLKQK
jgi:hypothetical protein